MIKLYLVNSEKRYALFVGHYAAEPTYEYIEGVTDWLYHYGPSKAVFVRPGLHAHYPWANGTGGVSAEWCLWMLTSGNHDCKPAGPWMPWPASPLQMLTGYRS